MDPDMAARPQPLTPLLCRHHQPRGLGFGDRERVETRRGQGGDAELANYGERRVGTGEEAQLVG
jgi:hypothetical protein